MIFRSLLPHLVCRLMCHVSKMASYLNHLLLIFFTNQEDENAGETSDAHEDYMPGAEVS